MSEWAKDSPFSEGDYWMRDHSGGPTLYEVIYVDGELCAGVKSRKLRLPVGDGMIDSAEWKKA